MVELQRFVAPRERRAGTGRRSRSHRSAGVSMSSGEATSPHSTRVMLPSCAARYARAPRSPPRRGEHPRPVAGARAAPDGRAAPVGRRGERLRRRPFVRRGEHPCHRGGPDAGLVHQGDQRGRRPGAGQRLQPGPQRGAHAGRPVRVVDEHAPRQAPARSRTAAASAPSTTCTAPAAAVPQHAHRVLHQRPPRYGSSALGRPPSRRPPPAASTIPAGRRPSSSRVMDPAYPLRPASVVCGGRGTGFGTDFWLSVWRSVRSVVFTGSASQTPEREC